MVPPRSWRPRRRRGLKARRASREVLLAKQFRRGSRRGSELSAGRTPRKYPGSVADRCVRDVRRNPYTAAPRAPAPADAPSARMGSGRSSRSGGRRRQTKLLAPSYQCRAVSQCVRTLLSSPDRPQAEPREPARTPPAPAARRDIIRRSRPTGSGDAGVAAQTNSRPAAGPVRRRDSRRASRTPRRSLRAAGHGARRCARRSATPPTPRPRSRSVGGASRASDPD